MNRVWEMFVTFSKFMTYLLTENTPAQHCNLPSHVKDAVYQLLIATIYFLQKIQYKIDKNVDKNHVHVLIEQLLSSEFKPVGNWKSILFPDTGLSGELENEASNQRLQNQCEIQKCIEGRVESSEQQETDSEQSTDLKKNTEAKLEGEDVAVVTTDDQPSESVDLKVSGNCRKCPDDSETEILPEVYYKIQELILTTNELIDYLNERLSRQKIKNPKYTSKFNEILTCKNLPSNREKESLHDFSEFSLQKGKQASSNQGFFTQKSKKNLKKFSEDLVKSDFSSIKKENLVHSSHSSEQLEAIDLTKSSNILIDKEKSTIALGNCSLKENTCKEEDMQSGVMVTSSLQRSAEETPKNEMRALNEIRRNCKGKENSPNGKKGTHLDSFNQKNGSKLLENEQKGEKSTEIGQTCNTSVLARRSIQKTKTVIDHSAFSQTYEKYVKNFAKNKFQGGAYYCEPCKQIFRREKKWESHCTESSQHFNLISLQNSMIVFEKCDLCRFAVLASEFVAKQHMLLHSKSHKEVSASDRNSINVGKVDSMAGKSEELHLESAVSSNDSENVIKNKMVKVQDLEKSFEECESDKKTCSEDCVSESEPQNAVKFDNNCRETDTQGAGAFQSIFKCKKNFKVLNRILRGNLNSEAFYCEPCDVGFLSKFKWNVHCSNFQFHQEAMKKDGSEHYQIRCRYCYLFVILPYNLIESYMRSHLRIHKIKNEEYKIVYSKKEQRHYFILNEFNEKLIEYCKDRNRKRDEIIRQILINPNNNLNISSQSSEGEQYPLDSKNVQEEMFPGQVKILRRNQSTNVISKDAIMAENITSSTGISKGIRPCPVETNLYVRSTLTEHSKKSTNDLPLFLGLCLFCEKSCKTPLEWSYHLLNCHHEEGYSVSCFKCALIIYGDPMCNLDELLSLAEHLCCQDIAKE